MKDIVGLIFLLIGVFMLCIVCVVFLFKFLGITGTLFILAFVFIVIGEILLNG